MKNPFKALAVLAMLIISAAAQEGDGYGFLNIANLVPGDTTCKITIGGEELVPDGLKGGAYTGWFMVKNGSKSISISRDDLDPASGAIQINEGVGNLIAIYLEPDTRPDTADKVYPPRLRIKSFPTYESKGFGLKFVSFCPGVNRFQLGPLKLEPKPFAPVEVPKWSGRGFDILRNGASIGNVSGSSESGAFYLFVGADGKDGYATVLVSSNAQEVPEYLKIDKTREESPTATPDQPDTQP
jgi:hypothetical protein